MYVREEKQKAVVATMLKMMMTVVGRLKNMEFK